MKYLQEGEKESQGGEGKRGRPGRSKGGEGERGGSMVDGWEDIHPETGVEEGGGRKR